MDSIRISLKGVEDGEVYAKVGQGGCAVVIDYGDALTSITVSPEKFEEWCEVVGALVAEHGHKVPRQVA